MELRTILLFGATVCIIFVVSSVSAHGGGGGGGRKKWMEAMKKCGDGEVNVEEMFKAKKECRDEFKKQAEGGAAKGDEEVERRRRSPDDEEEGGGRRKGKRKGGKGWGKGKWKNMACMGVCTHKKSGVLDQSGGFSESGAQAHVDKVYPESARAGIMEKMKACSADSSSKFSMDDNCSGYKDFQKCVWKAHMEVCNLKMGGFGGFGGGGKAKEKSSEEEEEE